jgi:hypothetical protein
MLALGHLHNIGYEPNPLTPHENKDGDAEVEAMTDITLAEELLHTCVDMYFDQPSGLSPERVMFHETRGKGDKEWYSVDLPGYLLRPETIESLYLIYVVTGILIELLFFISLSFLNSFLFDLNILFFKAIVNIKILDGKYLSQ